VNHYEVLGVGSSASAGELRRAYLTRARTHHPDIGGDDRSMTRLNEAWAVLSDPGQRRRYDAELGIRVRPTFAEPIVVDPDGGARLPFDADPDDLFDARPYSAARPARTGSLALVPPGIFMGSVAVGCVALVFDSPAMLGGAVVLFAVSCLAIAVVAMWTLRSGARR
jgi:hypothetical protein